MEIKSSYLKTVNGLLDLETASNISDLNCGKDDSQKKLYNLIWERAICSQMSNAIFDKTIVQCTRT